MQAGRDRLRGGLHASGMQAVVFRCVFAAEVCAPREPVVARTASANTMIAVRHMGESADNRELLQCTSIRFDLRVSLRMRTCLIIGR